MTDNNNQDKEFDSIDEIELNKSKWNLICDLKLLKFLKNNSDEFLDKIRKNLQELDDISFKTNSSANKINNLITSILILTNVKFIENRVYDEDIKDITTTKTNNNNNFNLIAAKQTTSKDDEEKFINRLENSIDETLKRLMTKYKLTNDDIISNNNNNSYNFLHKLYLQKNLFVQKKLPYLIGSDEYLKDTFVGLKNEDSQYETVIDFTETKQNDEISQIDENDNYNHQTNISKQIEEEEENILPPFFNTINVNKNEWPSTSETFEKQKTIIDIVKNDNSLLDESSEDDDIFVVRPTMNNRSIIFDQTDDDQLFQTASISPSNHENKTTNSFGNNFEKDYNNEKKVEIIDQIKNTDKTIFPNDFDNNSDDDIFTSRKSALKISVNESTTIFSSDDDDDDDLFKHIISKVPNKKSEKQPDANSLIINDESVEILSESKKKIESKPVLTNVIKELNSVLQKKVSLPEKEEASTISNITTTETKEISTNIIETNDELNSMLKHKLNLSSNRQRKPPSRNILRKSLTNSQPLFENNENDIVVNDNDVESKTHNNNNLSLQLETEKVSDIKIEPKKFNNIIEKITTNNLIDEKKSTTILSSKSLFDSSDSGDDDIFKKPNLIHNHHQTSNAKKTEIILSLDSDDDEELDFQPFNLSSKLKDTKQPTITSRTITTNNTIKPTHQVTKKSIFDDSDSDDGKFFD